VLFVDIYSKAVCTKEFEGTNEQENTDEIEANAMTCTLFQLLLQWTVADDNLFIW
jgi:hypothetical protein